MPRRTRDAEGKKLDAHAKTVAQAQKTLKELETLLSYHEALTIAFRAKLAGKERKR